MPVFDYGTTQIEWYFKLDNKLKSHYITVERDKAVLLRGPGVDEQQQKELIKHRARWIKQKLVEVNQAIKEEIVTGSRAVYRGRSYYCEIIHDDSIKRVDINFNHSKFSILSPKKGPIPLTDFKLELERFYSKKASEKLGSRIRYWQRETGLEALTYKIKKLKSRWGNCTENNVIEFNPKIMEFSGSVIDYIIIHELCHTVEKKHNKEFWNLVASHCPDWKKHHEEVEQAGKMEL
ncbi:MULTISPECIES: M48 family metallopeptidase [unclassified Pseudoalteromonas]|uniref:M48 family metallopeptidase n=1 Tax=unclassified Pseudoalteromonas TaxID=194690 RepID=UPI0005AB25B2|nr:MULTISPECIES: SprT family zinc-dependent metalloprotease [unclassified Pseudoalteromonas]